MNPLLEVSNASTAENSILEMSNASINSKNSDTQMNTLPGLLLLVWGILNSTCTCIGSIPSSLQPIDETLSEEEQKCKGFIERTCGCSINKGSPRSSLIPLEAYVSHRAEAAGLTRDQLDLVLVGAVMSMLNTNEITHDKNHKSKGRQRIYSHYLFGGQRVCRHTFQFLLGVGKDQLQAIKSRYMENS